MHELLLVENDANHADHHPDDNIRTCILEPATDGITATSAAEAAAASVAVASNNAKAESDERGPEFPSLRTLGTLAFARLVSAVVLFPLLPLRGWCPRLWCFPLRSTRWVGHSRRCVVGVRGCVVPKGHSIIMRVYMGGSGSLSDLCTLKVQSVVQHIPPTHYLRTVHYQHTGGIMRNTRRVQASHGLLLR